MNSIPLKLPDGRTALEYVTGREPYAGFIHPLYTPAGKVITDLAPPDHPHHRGVFLAWYAMHGKVDGDFWGWGAHAPVEGRRIVNRSAELAGTKLCARNDWLAGDSVMLTEETNITCREPFVVDIEYRLTPAFDLRLAQSAFAGFCVRLPREKPVRFFNPAGEVTLPDPHFQQPATCWPNAGWYRAEVEGVGSVTVTPAVGNPPAGWFNHRELKMLNPCITAPGELRLAGGQPFTLGYRERWRIEVPGNCRVCKCKVFRIWCGQEEGFNGRDTMNQIKLGRLVVALALVAPLAAQASYFSEVMSKSPLLYYRLGESSGPTASDSSGNSYHGTYFSANVVYGETGALPLDPNTAVRFQGNLGTTRIDTPVTTFNPTAPWTVSLWIKPENVGEPKGIVSQKDGSGTGRSLIYQNHDGSGSYFSSYLGGTDWGWGGGYITAFGTYLHLALVYNGSGGLQWYTNGLPAASHSGVSVEAANGAFVIAAAKDNSGPLRGTLDEVAIFQSALSASDILNQYNSFDDPPLVPEPSTLLLLVTGAALVWHKRRMFSRQ